MFIPLTFFIKFQIHLNFKLQNKKNNKVKKNQGYFGLFRGKLGKLTAKSDRGV
jgi:hypothetical protein